MFVIVKVSKAKAIPTPRDAGTDRRAGLKILRVSLREIMMYFFLDLEIRVWDFPPTESGDVKAIHELPGARWIMSREGRSPEFQ